MPLIKGAATYTLFLVEGADVHPDAFSSRRFVPLTVAGEAEESAGWVLFDDPHEPPGEDRPTLTDVTFGSRTVVVYREDRWAIPKSLIKRETKKRIQALIDSGEKSEDDVGRAFTKAVEQAVAKELRATSRPKTKIVEVVIDGPIARVFAKGRIAHERIAALLGRTLKADVVHVHPAEVAVRTMAPDLAGIIPTEFFGVTSDGAGLSDVEG